MPIPLNFKSYSPVDRDFCLAIFDANCPAFFAANERRDYERFLDSNPAGYEICLWEGKPVGAYGLSPADTASCVLTWVLLDPDFQQRGIGTEVIQRAIIRARSAGKSRIEIGASHLSAPFFARFGAKIISLTRHGWGPDMHRVEMQIILD